VTQYPSHQLYYRRRA